LQNGINTANPHKIIYQTETANYYINGGIRKDLDSLKVTLVIEHPVNTAKSRNKLDLYEDKQTEKIARESAEKLSLRADLIEFDLNMLTDLLDEYRESITSTSNEESKLVEVPHGQKEKCIGFLKSGNVLHGINELIGQSGVVGEDNNRIFLFGIASSYKMYETMHALIQGSSGSGKTHLLATIMDFMPSEDTLSLTRVTESSFYNYGKYDLQNKLIGMEDFDGLEEKAELAFRELQSKGMISSSTSGKNENTGEITGFIKEVYGPIASLSATTKGEIYEDNMSRCFLVAVDESQEQTQRIIKYQNSRAAGKIDEAKEKEIRDFLRNCIRLLKPYKVVNPYADRIELPKEAHKIRRLNDLFQSYVKQVTLLNQYQRKTDKQGRLITEKEDVQTAVEIMFDSIILKVDELDGSLRSFYEKLKSFVLKHGKEYEFTRLEVRQVLMISKTQQHSYLNQLIDLEYIQQVGGYANRGFKYKIHHWDNNEKLRSDIRIYLNKQLEKL
jgi:energy-coupling factor transporter ATP-binding protein EcfA2